MTTDYRSKDIDRLGVEAIETSIKNGQSSTSVGVSLDPKNLQQVIRRTDAYGGGFTTGTEAQIISEAGQVQLFSIQNGQSSLIPKNLLVAKLREVNEDGMAVWTSRQNEAATPVKPTYLCLLHKDHPLRFRADELGFTVCEKKMTNPKDVLDHSKKHSRAWDAFEQDKADAKEAKTDAWQQASMAAITSSATEGNIVQTQMLEKACTECGDSVFATNLESVSIKLQVHMRQHLSPKSFEVSDEWLRSPTMTSYPEPELPTPNSAQELLLAKVQNFPGWCKEPDCEFVTDSKSASGAKISLSYHVRKEHPND